MDTNPGMKKEFVEQDLPLAQMCLARVSGDKDAQHLVKPFRAWFESLKAQFDAYEAASR